MKDTHNELTESYYRCKSDKQFLDTFYEVFLSMSPDIAKKFENTNFKFQKILLRQSLLEMICFDLGLAGTREEIERLGVKHRELEIQPAMYAMWLDALYQEVAKHDPEFTPELEATWRESMQKSIDEMISISGV